MITDMVCECGNKISRNVYKEGGYIIRCHECGNKNYVPVLSPVTFILSIKKVTINIETDDDRVQFNHIVDLDELFVHFLNESLKLGLDPSIIANNLMVKGSQELTVGDLVEIATC